MSENKISPAKALIFQTAYLGDVVLTTPLIRTAAHVWKDSSIWLACQPQWIQAVSRLPGLSGILPYAKRNADRGTFAMLQIARQIKQQGFDLVLCPHPSFRSGLILRMANIPIRIGFHDSAGSLFFNCKVHREVSAHESLRMLSLLDAAGVARDKWICEPMVIPDPNENIDRFLETFGLKPDSKIAAVHPGSVWATKRWLPEGFAAVADELVSNYGFHVFILGGKDDVQVANQTQKAAKLPHLNIAGRTSLNQLIALLARITVLVTNDSGPAHLASALGKRVVAIFGSTVPAQGYAPMGLKSKVVEVPLNCRPCGPHGHQKCPLGHFQCMHLVTSKLVLDAVEGLCS